MQLSNEDLFHQQCYVGGAWIDADSLATTTVTNPADGRALGTVPRRVARSRLLPIDIHSGEH